MTTNFVHNVRPSILPRPVSMKPRKRNFQIRSQSSRAPPPEGCLNKLILAKSSHNEKQQPCESANNTTNEEAQTVDTQDLENLLEPYKPKQRRFNSFEQQFINSTFMINMKA